MSSRASKSLETVSIHGLPHVAGANSVSRCAAWCVLFVAASSAFTVHMMLLLSRFAAAPINTELSLDAADFRFPDLFICNPVVVSPSRANEKLWQKKYLQYEGQLFLKFLEQLNSKTNDTTHDTEAINYIYRRFLWSTTPAEHLPWVNNQQQTIIKVTLNSRTLDLGSFQTVPHDTYQTCFKFLNASLLRSPRDKLGLYLYADSSQLPSVVRNAETLSSMSYSGKRENDKSSGLLLFFTEKDHYPDDFDVEHIAVSCGMHTKVEVESVQRSLISTHSSACRAHERTVEIINNIDPRATLRYNMDRRMCIAINVALHYHQLCGCVPLTFPIPEDMRNTTARCLDMKKWSPAQAADNWLCMNKISYNDIHEVMKIKCKGSNQCDREIYNLRWSNAAWPTVNLVKSFVRNVIQEVYDQRADHRDLLPGWKNVLNAPDHSLMTMVRENVVKVDISPRSHFSTCLVQSYAYPAVQMFSDVGGILGLYLGMSILSLFELLEVVVLILKRDQDEEAEKEDKALQKSQASE